MSWGISIVSKIERSVFAHYSGNWPEADQSHQPAGRPVMGMVIDQLDEAFQWQGTLIPPGGHQ